MGKRKITSFFVIAAAMLVALPTLAQSKLNREEIKAIAFQKKAKTLNAAKPSDAERMYPLVAKDLKKVTTFGEKKGQLLNASAITKPVGPRKNVAVKNLSNGQSLISAAGCDILATNVFTESQSINVEQINTNDPTKPETLVEGVDFNATNGGGLADGIYYGAELYNFLGLAYFPYIYTLNTEDWTWDYASPADFSLMGVYDTATSPSGDIYGVFYNADGSNYEFGIVDYASLTRTTIATWPINAAPLAFGISSDNVGYAVCTDGGFYKIDLATGTPELIGAAGYAFAMYYQTGEIDQKTNTFYWLAPNNDGTSTLLTVDLETGAATEIANLGISEYVDAVIMAPAAEDGAPAAIADLEGNFKDGETTGTISFTAPTTTFAGEDLAGSLNFYVNVAGQVVKEGVTAAGEKVEVEVTVPEGMQTIYVTTKNEVGESPKSNKIKQWFGLDVPDAPENLTFTYADGAATVTWDPVVVGSHGGYVGDVTYTVTRVVNGEETVVAEGLTETTFVDEFEVDEMSAIYYAVTALNGSADIITGYTNVQPVGEAFELPFAGTFANSDPIVNLCTVIDANEDDATWAYDSSSGAFYGTYNSSMAADDYLVLPAIKVRAGKAYTVSVDISAGSYAERFEVVAGLKASVEALTIPVIEPTDVTNIPQTAPETFTGEFTAEEDGDYYIAIHQISDPDQFWIRVHSFSIEGVPTAESAKAPRLAVQPDPYGANNAVITVTAPSRQMDGNALPSLTKMNVYRDGKVIASYTDVKPEDIKVFKDEQISGVHKYYAIAFDQYGDAGQKSPVITAMIGLDVPAAPEECEIADNGSSLTISWDAVTTGNNGGLVVPGEIVYTVYECDNQGTPVTEFGSTTDTELTFDYDTNAGEQHVGVFYILPSNDAGSGQGLYAYQYLGESYSMPIEESFGNPLNYSTWTYWTSSSNIGAYLTDYASDDNNSALMFNSETDNEWALLSFGKVKVRQGNPVLMFDAASTSVANELTVEAQTPDGDIVTIAKIDAAEEYEPQMVSLKDFADEDYIIISFRAEMEEAGSIFIDNMKIFDQMEYNLVAQISAPKSVKAGEGAKVNVVVTNMGINEAENFTVKVFADKEQLFSETVKEPLAVFGKKNFSADLNTTIFDDPKDITLTAEVSYELDLDDEDNVAEAVITLVQSAVAQPENVKAEKNGSDVVLTWNAPSSTISDVTEGFEDAETFPAFSLGGIDADNAYGAFGEWTVYDGNRMHVYGFNGLSFPNMTEIGAWQVWTPGQVEGLDNYMPANGEQCLISWCPADEAGTPAADHWLISPELPGVAQTISFNYREIVDNYGPEAFKVLYSTTDNKVESFTKIGEYQAANVEWQNMSVELPAGTKYFAIRHVAQDIFALLIDDVTYTRGGGDVAKYNIYVDGEDGVYESVTETTYTIKNIGSAKWVAVSAVMGNGKESRPVVVEISGANQEITAIEQLTGNNKPVDVYSIDGKLVRQEATDLKGLKGAYIINGQKVVIK